MALTDFGAGNGDVCFQGAERTCADREAMSANEPYAELSIHANSEQD